MAHRFALNGMPYLRDPSGRVFLPEDLPFLDCSAGERGSGPTMSKESCLYLTCSNASSREESQQTADQSQFPEDLFSLEQRQRGAVFLHLFGIHQNGINNNNNNYCIIIWSVRSGLPVHRAGHCLRRILRALVGCDHRAAGHFGRRGRRNFHGCGRIGPGVCAYLVGKSTLQMI
jgi:hypothetical protein